MKLPPSPPIPRHVGGSYVAMRPGHRWHAKSVTVIEKTDDQCRCTLDGSLRRGLLAKPGSRRRKVRVETFTEEELW